MEQGLVSLVIPAYNAEKFLEGTLKSVINQQYKKLEVIIINDGSVDGTQQIIDKYEKEYPQIIHSFQQSNCGQSATRNRALEYVTGEYLAYVDADDIIEPDYVSVLVECAIKEQADIVVAGYIKFETDTGEVVYKRNAKDWDVEFDHNLHHVFQYSPAGKLFLTEFIKKHNFQFSVGEQLEDGPYGVMTHIVADKVVIVDYCGYRYRIHATSTMGNVRKKKAHPKVPYRGIEAAILKVREYKKDKETDEVLEYCIIKVLAGLTTNMYKSCDRDTRKQVCRFCYIILDKYFPEATKNPYIGVFKLKKLPIVHRVAVALFMIAYRLKLLYPFSACVSKFL